MILSFCSSQSEFTFDMTRGPSWQFLKCASQKHSGVFIFHHNRGSKKEDDGYGSTTVCRKGQDSVSLKKNRTGLFGKQLFCQ